MKTLFDSDLELVHDSGFLCFPLLLDPSVAGEVEGDGRNPLVVRVGGRRWVRTLSLRSLVEGYDGLCPDAYRDLRRSCLERICGDPAPLETGVSERLRTILFSVMPHFLRRGKSLDRRKLSEDDLLDVIGERIGLSIGPVEPAGSRLNPASVGRILAILDRHRPAVGPPAEGLLPASALRNWLQAALEGRIVEKERRRLTDLLKALERLGSNAGNRMAILQHVAETGALELDGFGFLRIGPGEEYLIYKRIGEYALSDYYGRLYLFPGCRVAVSTAASLRPFVVETYKHPFLAGHDSGQAVCLRNFNAPDRFSGTAVVEALEEGINALLYGYSSRRRNGYHSLEGSPKRTGRPGFGDPLPRVPAEEPVRSRPHILDVDFEDYRVPADHPRIVSGEVEVTNSFVP